MIDPRTRYRLSEHSRFRTVAGEGLVVRQDEAELLAFNGSAARMLELLTKQHTGQQIIDTLIEEYEVDKAKLTEDLSKFTQELLALNVLEPAPAEQAL